MTHTSDALARRNVRVLVAAQAILGAQMPMIFTIAGLAGTTLSPNICWATLPITMAVVGSMLTATPAVGIDAAAWPSRGLRRRRHGRAWSARSSVPGA